jgi:hypothetical protein
MRAPGGRNPLRRAIRESVMRNIWPRDVARMADSWHARGRVMLRALATGRNPLMSAGDL